MILFVVIDKEKDRITYISEARQLDLHQNLSLLWNFLRLIPSRILLTFIDVHRFLKLYQ